MSGFELEGTDAILPSPEKVFVYRRTAGGKSVAVALNMSANPGSVTLPARGKILVDSIAESPASIQGNALRLAPFQGVVVAPQ